jgi:glyoxylase-like metal-dependent hydrolase (beta-lactamase superfamily II)
MDRGLVSPPDAIVVEIGPETWRLQGRVGERNVFQYLLASEDRDALLLIDTGLTETPREVVMPALRSLGLREAALSMIVVTHPDVDHQGGLAGLREVCEHAVAACGFRDQAMVRDPEKMVADRYRCYEREHGMGLTAEELGWCRANYGAPAEIDLTFSGGETVRLGDRQLDVLAAPGHSAGHLVLFERDTGMLFSSDAVHWRACPAADGSPALCPTYEEVGDYLETIALLESLEPTELHSGHWPARSGSEVLAFLDESREFVARVDSVLGTLLEQPLTLAEACREVQAQAGPWASEPEMLRFAVSGHLRRMMREGAIERVEPTRGPLRYRRRAPEATQALQSPAQITG